MGPAISAPKDHGRDRGERTDVFDFVAPVPPQIREVPPEHCARKVRSPDVRQHR